MTVYWSICNLLEVTPIKMAPPSLFRQPSTASSSHLGLGPHNHPGGGMVTGLILWGACTSSSSSCWAHVYSGLSWLEGTFSLFCLLHSSTIFSEPCPIWGYMLIFFINNCVFMRLCLPLRYSATSPQLAYSITLNRRASSVMCETKRKMSLCCLTHRHRWGQPELGRHSGLLPPEEYNRNMQQKRIFLNKVHFSIVQENLFSLPSQVQWSKRFWKPDRVMRTYNLSTWEEEAVGLSSNRG
jgi:hypothetical protein